MLGTLAHHVEIDPAAWIEYTNKIDGLVKLAARQETAEKHSDVHWHNILSALFDVYETLRQVVNYSHSRCASIYSCIIVYLV